MYKEKHRINAIVNELVSFLLRKSASLIKINISESENVTRVQVFGNIPTIDKEEMENLENSLISPRAEEIEELYWELVGVTNNKDDLGVLGAMIDESNVDYTDSNGIIITISRNKNTNK